MTASRSGVSEGAVLFVIMIVLIAAGAYVWYEQSLIPKASISISWGGSSCSSLDFQVTNNDNKLLHSWMATVTVSPQGASITVSPNDIPIITLAPQGSYNQAFNINYNGAAPGQYTFIANIVNGTQTIATSKAIDCTVG